MRVFSNANYDFIGRRRAAYVVSAVALALGLVAALVFQIGRGSWLNYGVDFTGGTLVQVAFEESTSVAELRTLFNQALPGSEITRFGGDDEFLIRAPQFDEEGSQVSGTVVEVLTSRFQPDQFDVVRTEAVGPKIGSELQQRASLAILLSFAFTLIYLAFRFEWRFGVAAIIATLHDILITLGLIAGFQLEVSLPTVAAVLTIVGYSLNDTIIVFDRIRENLKKSGRRDEFMSILNRSINEVLPRTVLTSLSTLGTLAALFLFGGEIIRGFAMIMIVGIIVGTYSSVFVATPALLVIERRWGKQKERPKRTRPVRAGAGV